MPHAPRNIHVYRKRHERGSGIGMLENPIRSRSKISAIYMFARAKMGSLRNNDGGISMLEEP